MTYRRACLRLLVACTAVLGCVFLFNAAIDPSGLWGSDLVEDHPGDLRSRKLSTIDGAGRFDLLVLGDSRAQRLRPADVLAITGHRTFNASLSSGTPSQQLHLYEHLRRRHRPPRYVIYVIGPENLNNDAALKTGPLDVVQRSLTATETRTSLNHLLAVLGLRRSVDPFVTYAPDGHEVRNVDWTHDAADPRTEPAASSVQRTTALLRRHYSHEFFPREVKALRELVVRLNRDGVRPILVVPPYHPDLEARLGAPLQRRLRTFERLIEAIGDRTELGFVDGAELSSIGGETGEFADGLHTGERNLRRLIEFVVAQDDDAL